MFDVIPLSISVIDAASVFRLLVENASYLFVFIFMVIESSFLPFPSEVVVPPAAYLACTRGDLNLFLIVLAATAGAVTGSLINYYLSVWIGRPVIYKFADSRLGHACMIDRAKVQRAERFFDKNGEMSTFVGRLVPVVRQLISIPAGLAKMNITAFILFTALGALIWNVVLAALGFWLSKRVGLEVLYAKVEQYNTHLTHAGIVLGALLVAYIVWKALKPQEQEQEQQQ